MASTTSVTRNVALGDAAATLSWRSWPLVDGKPWTWIVPIGIAGVGVAIWYMGRSWLLGTAAMVGLAITLRHFLVPVHYEVASLGIRRLVMRHSRLVPWHAMRAYQLRATGVVLYQRSDPTKLDLMRSFFVPYPSDPDDLIAAIRPHLTHAVELR
jgi:hypothetical protein